MITVPLIISFAIVAVVFVLMLLDKPIRRMKKLRSTEVEQDRVCKTTKRKLTSHYRKHSSLLGNWYDPRQFCCHLNKLLSHFEAFKSEGNDKITADQFLLRQARSLKQLVDRRIIAAELEKFAIENNCGVPKDELDQILLDVTDHNRPFVDSVDLALSVKRQLEQSASTIGQPKPKAGNTVLCAYQLERAKQERELRKILSPNAGLAQLNAELDRHMNEWMYQQAGGN